MKATGIRNAILLFIGGLITWVLLIWLPHRGLGDLGDALGSYRNLPPLTVKVFVIQKALLDAKYFLLGLHIVLCIGYYFFYRWASNGPASRMSIHNVVMIAIFVTIYGFLIYSVFGLRTVVRGIQG